MANNKFNNDYNSSYENIKFIPAQIFYQVIQNIELNFSDFCITHNIDGMMMLYRFLYSKIFPYLRNVATEDEVISLEISDLYDLKSKLRNGDSEYDVKQNNLINSQLEQNIMHKLDIFNELRKRASFDVFIEKSQWKPSALASDDL